MDGNIKGLKGQPDLAVIEPRGGSKFIIRPNFDCIALE